MMDIKYSLGQHCDREEFFCNCDIFITTSLDTLIEWTNCSLVSLYHFFCQVLLSACFNLGKRFQT